MSEFPEPASEHTAASGRSDPDRSEAQSAVERHYLLVTEYFYPDQLGTGRLMTDLATGLVERGLDLTVYTGQPHYFGNDNGRQPNRDNHEGVPVRRIRAPQVELTSLLRRVFNWATFTVWVSLVLLVRRADENQEVVFVSNPPFLPIAMWLVCSIRGWPYTYIVHDLYPPMAVEPGFIKRGGLIDRSWSAFNEYVFDGAENVVVLGERMRERVVEEAGAGFDADKTHVVHNWEDASFITPRSKAENWFSEEYGLVDRFVVTYSGNIGANHDLDTVVRAADRLRDSDVKFVVIGEGDRKGDVVAHADRHGLTEETIEFLPFQDRADLPYSLTAGDVSLVTISPGMKGVAVSSKVYTSLAAGQPVLVVAEPDDDEAETVRRYDAGEVVQQGDVDGIVEAIETWKANPELVSEQGENARRALVENFDKERMIDRYYELLTEPGAG